MSPTAGLAVCKKREISFPLPTFETRIVQPARPSQNAEYALQAPFVAKET